MDGEPFRHFVGLLVRGFIAARKAGHVPCRAYFTTMQHRERFVVIVDIIQRCLRRPCDRATSIPAGSNMPCFVGGSDTVKVDLHLAIALHHGSAGL